ncbi:hypothetical protein [Phascolarctobacterium sp.]
MNIKTNLKAGTQVLAFRFFCCKNLSAQLFCRDYLSIVDYNIFVSRSYDRKNSSRAKEKKDF